MESLLGDGHQLRNTLAFPIRGSMLKEMEETEKEEVIGSSTDQKQLMASEIEIINEILYHGDFAYTEMDSNIKVVIREEAAAYFAGDKSAEEVAHIIQSKVQLILNE